MSQQQPPNNKRPIAVTSHYGQQQQRRGRFQQHINVPVSPRDVLDPARRRPSWRPPLHPSWTWRNAGNTSNNYGEGRSGVLKRSYVGALIYRTGGEAPECDSGELAVHVFDGYRVKIRRLETESRAVDRFSKKKPLRSHLSSNLFVVQKLVPVQYSTQTYFELDLDGGFKQRHEVTLNFQRKFVTKLVCSFEPSDKCFYSEAYLNVF
ncbi:hypothetical protein quinque_011718 [Culex quinquefasciatus]